MNQKAKLPPRKPDIKRAQVLAYKYRIEVVESGKPKIYVLHSANPLELSSLGSKKPGDAEISGKELAKALRGGKINTLMPGIETFAIITEMAQTEYHGKTVEVEVGKVPALETFKKIAEWEKAGSLKISFEGAEGISRKSLGLASAGKLSGLRPRKVA